MNSWRLHELAREKKGRMQYKTKKLS